MRRYSTSEDFESPVEYSNALEQYYGWTFKAIDFKINTLLPYKPKLFLDNEPVELSDTKPEYKALIQDLYEFNPYQTLSEARSMTRSHLGLTGVAYWLPRIKGGKRAFQETRVRHEFYVLNPNNVEVKTDKRGLPSRYEYEQPNGKKIQFRPEDIIVWKRPDPRYMWKGHSELNASRFAHNIYEYASRYNQNTFGNNGVPEGLLISEELTEETRNALERQLKSKYGGVENAGKIGVSNTGFEFLRIGLSNKDLAYAEAMTMSRDEILAIHGVPLDLLGLGASTYANAGEAQKVYQRYTLKPMLDYEAEVLTSQLIPKYFIDGLGRNIEFRFDDPVDQDRKEQGEVASTLYMSQLVTKNEARSLVGMNPVDDGDEFKGDNILAPILEATPSAPEDEVPEGKSKSVDIIPREPELESKSERDTMKANFKNLSNDRELEMLPRIFTAFEQQQERVLETVRAVKTKGSRKDVDLDFDVTLEASRMLEALSPYIEDLSEESVSEALGQLDGSYLLTTADREFIKESLKGSLALINETTQRDIADLIARANEDDLGVEDTSRLLRELYEGYGLGDEEGLSRYRTIARTEINRTVNHVHRQVYAADDTVQGLEWVSVGDSDVRSAHLEADGQVVTKDARFTVGGELMNGPGDPSASAANVVNCRCRVIPVI